MKRLASWPAGLVIFAFGAIAGAMLLKVSDPKRELRAIAPAAEGTASVTTPSAPEVAPDADSRPTPSRPAPRGEVTASTPGEPIASAVAASAATRIQDLEAKLASAEKERDELRTRLASAEAARGDAGPGEEPDIAFGDWAELEAIRQANWAEAGGAVKTMSELVTKVLALGHENPAARPLQIEIAKENQKLVKLALAAMGKLPTHAPGNGEYTHPIILANLAAEHLELAGVPLDDGQKADLERLGDQYDLEWHFAQRAYDNETPPLRKIVDELDLKKRFCDRLEGLLRAEQLAVLAPSGIRHIFLVDLHSPVLMLIGTTEVVSKSSEVELRAEATKKWIGWLAAEGSETRFFSGSERDAADLEASPMFGAWWQAITTRLTPVAKDHAILFHIDDALVAGRAQLALMDALVREAPTDELRWKVRAILPLLIPRLVAAK